MKKIYLLLIVLCSIKMANAQIINFPDANFKARLVNADVSTGTVRDSDGNSFRLDSNYDGQIQLSEALLVKEMDVFGQNGSNRYRDLTGIENFTNLESLRCGGGNPIQNLNISNLVQLKKIGMLGNRDNFFGFVQFGQFAGTRLWC